MARFLMLLVLALGSWGCGTSGDKDCRVDTECTVGSHCGSGGTCETSCKTDQECKGGYCSTYFGKCMGQSPDGRILDGGGPPPGDASPVQDMPPVVYPDGQWLPPDMPQWPDAPYWPDLSPPQPDAPVWPDVWPTPDLLPWPPDAPPAPDAPQLKFDSATD